MMLTPSRLRLIMVNKASDGTRYNGDLNTNGNFFRFVPSYHWRKDVLAQSPTINQDKPG